MEANGQIHSRLPLTSWKSRRYPLNGGLGRFRADLGVFERGLMCCFCRNSKQTPRLSGTSPGHNTEQKIPDIYRCFTLVLSEPDM
jgi:hypothetical protein